MTFEPGKNSKRKSEDKIRSGNPRKKFEVEIRRKNSKRKPAKKIRGGNPKKKFEAETRK